MSTQPPGKSSLRKVRPARTESQLAALPDSALISETENCAVLNISRTYNWRCVKTGSLPPPIKIGKRMNRYVIGSARKAARGEDWREA